MFTIVLVLVLLSVLIGLVLWTTVEWKNQDPYDSWGLGVIFSWGGVCLVLLIFSIEMGSQYTEAIYLPLRLEALNGTIEEQSAFITIGEGTVAQGLEGLEIKREIQQTIRDRNELIATIRYRQRSPWYLFKPAFPINEEEE